MIRKGPRMAGTGAGTRSPSPPAVWVWLPEPAHAVVRGRAEAAGVSMPVLVRQAAEAAVGSPGGRIKMPAPPVEAVERLRAAGYRLNGLVAALNEMLAGVSTLAQYRALAAQLRPMLNEVSGAAAEVRVDASVQRTQAGDQDSDDTVPAGSEGRWKKIMVTTDSTTLSRWESAAEAAGFRSMPNWIRDAMAGTYQLAIPRPPALVTIQARTVVGRVSGLVAQVQLAADQIAVVDRICSGPAETAGTELAACLESLVVYGGDVKARR